MSTPYKHDVISRLQDTRSDLARLLVEHPDKDLLANDVTRGIRAATDLISALQCVDLDLFVVDNPVPSDDTGEEPDF